MSKPSEIEQLQQQIQTLEGELAAEELAREALEKQLIATSQQFAEILQDLEDSNRKLKESQQAQNNTLSFIETAFNSMDSLLLTTDPRGRITRFNDNVKNQLGYSSEELEGSLIDMIFAPDQFNVENSERRATRSKLYSLFAHQTEFSGQYQLRRSDDTSLSYVLKGNLLHDKFGKEVGGILTGINITPLLKNQLQLQKTETVLNLLLKTANDAIIVIDDSDKIQVWNRKSEELFGYSREEIIGKNMHDFIVSQEDRASYLAHNEHFRKTGEGDILNQTREVIAHRKDGSVFDAELSISSGKLDGRWHAFGLVRNVTERNRAKQALIEAKVEADKANVAKSQFLATMSHEIRTPLNGVLGLLHMLQQTRLDLNQQELVDKTQFSAKSLLAIINDILDFSKVEAGKMELDHSPFSIHSIRESVMAAIEVKASQKGVFFSYNESPGLPVDYVGDVMRINQVVLNLCSNAVKFTEQGGVTVDVKEVSRNDTHCVVKFSVTDTGVGIAKEHQKVLFESFKQVDSSTTRKFGGTGLGLAISQKLIHLLGGHIDVESEEGHGSCFSFQLTLELNNNYVITHQPPAVFAQRLQFMLVDDNETALDILAHVLNDMQASVAKFHSPIEALKQAVAAPPDVLMVDLKMPDIDGIEFFRIFLDEVRDNSTICLLMSSYNKEKVREIAPLNLDGVLEKPIDLDILKTLIENRLQHSEQVTEDQHSLINKKVLLVEDNEINFVVAESILSDLGLIVEHAENGQIAIDKVAESQYDVILMDIHMPVLDGIAATRHIREKLKIETPIIALTADVVGDESNNFQCIGMNAYLAKPLDIEQLEVTLKSFV